MASGQVGARLQVHSAGAGGDEAVSGITGAMGGLKLVRRANVDDAPAIAVVHVASWRTSYKGLLPDDYLAAMSEPTYEEQWRGFIDRGTSLIYVAEEDDGIVGFVSGGHERAGEDEFGGELYAIYVLEAAQGHGHGRELVRAMVGGLREMGFADMVVWVLRDNAPGRRFYERLGGAYVREQSITIASTSLKEVAYGWRRLGDVRY
jgi:ribosomal protein S18 acetylase RimI-like enzyme